MLLTVINLPTAIAGLLVAGVFAGVIARWIIRFIHRKKDGGHFGDCGCGNCSGCDYCSRGDSLLLENRHENRPGPRSK